MLSVNVAAPFFLSLRHTGRQERLFLRLQPQIFTNVTAITSLVTLARSLLTDAVIGLGRAPGPPKDQAEPRSGFDLIR